VGVRVFLQVSADEAGVPGCRAGVTKDMPWLRMIRPYPSSLIPFCLAISVRAVASSSVAFGRGRNFDQ
jgi:hypothetical protein